MTNNIKVILHKSATVVVLSAAVAVCRSSSAAFDPSVDLKSPESVYIAPTSLISYRMHHADGLFRELDRGEDAVSQIVGSRGWHGTVRGKKITVWSGRDAKDASAEYLFKDGRLAEMTLDGEKLKVTDRPPRQREEPIDALWPEFQEGRRNEKAFFDVWRNMGRLRVFFENPNKTALLFVQFGLIALAFLALRGRVWKAAGVAVSLVFFFLTVKTGSRSGVLAFLAGISLITAFMIPWKKMLRGRKKQFLIGLFCGIVLLAGAFALGPKRVTHAFFETGSSRVEIMKAVPQMMCDAPDGWGWYAGGYMTGPGKAYHDWYQPVKRFSMTLTLVSDHLTQLVRLGWTGRFGYLTAWAVLLIVLFWASCRNVIPIPLALWTAFLVCTGANRVMEEWTLWIVPCAATAAVSARMWRAMGPRRIALSFAASVCLSGLTLGGIVWVAEDADGFRVRTEEKRVYVKNLRNPDRWLVDDGTVFGGGFFGKEMRLFYRANPSAPGLGYVRDVLDLPDNVHKLVLGGRSGWDFLMALNDGRFRSTFKMPKKILFVSPPFPPQAIPELMLKNVDVKFIVGEFATSYFKAEYASPPSWVTVLDGVELYVPDWMKTVTKL